MPELPEVETIRRQLCAAGLEGRVIKNARVLWPRTVEPLDSMGFCGRVTGRKLIRLERQGKWLIFVLNGPDNMLAHLRMTGGFYLTHGALRAGPYDRVLLQLSGQLNLHFRDPRKFGRWRLADVPAGLGPDALSLTQKSFLLALLNKNKALKALLLDQSFIAGVGNIYADEILFAARLHPRRKSATLSADEQLALYRSVGRIIRAAVRNKGTSLGSGQGNYVDLDGESGGHRERVKVYGRAGAACPACGCPLHKTTIAQRATVFCPHCQLLTGASAVDGHNTTQAT